MVEHREHDVLDGDIFVLHARGKLLRLRENLVRDGRNVHLVRLSAAAADCGHLLYLRVQLREQVVRVDARPLQKHGYKPAVLVNQCVKQMLGHYLYVLILDCYVLRGVHRLQRLLCEFLRVHTFHLLQMMCAPLLR